MWRYMLDPLLQTVSYEGLLKLTNSTYIVLLTVHLSITLVNDQLDTQLLYIYNIFITVLYMFRGTSCSSSGGQIVLIQNLISHSL